MKGRQVWASGVLLAMAAVAGAQYAIQDIGVLPIHAGGSSFGYSISNSGQVAGYSSPSGSFDFRAVRWNAGALENLGTLGGNKSIGYDLNDAGNVVGASNIATDGFNHAFLKELGSGMVDLGNLGGEFAESRGINASDWVTGYSWINGGGSTRAFLKKPGSAMQNLGTLDGNSYGRAINDAGQIAGDYDLSGGDRHAFRWSEGGGMVDIGVLSGGHYAVSSRINSGGAVVGYSTTTESGSTYAAFVYRDGFGMTQLAGLRGLGEYDDRARGINAAGDAVGSSWTGTSGDTSRAVLWAAGGGVVDLNTLIDPGSGWELTVAYGINDAGQITGYGKVDGDVRGFVMTPVPEPGTLVALLGGVAVIFRLKRKRA